MPFSNTINYSSYNPYAYMGYNYIYPDISNWQNNLAQSNQTAPPFWNFNNWNSLGNNYSYPYNQNFNYPNFTGVSGLSTQFDTTLPTQTTTSNTTPPKEQPPTQDSEPTKKSNLGKWAIGALAVIGIGAFILSKGKIKSKGAGGEAVSQAGNVIKKVEFKAAQNIDEAKKFAQENFGVQYHNIDDLSSINYLNEWIAKTHNSCKTLNMRSYPRIISNTNLDDGLACAMEQTFKHGNIEECVIGIDMSLFKDFDKTLKKLSGDGSIIKKLDSGKFAIVDDAYNTEFTKDLIKRINSYNPATTSMKEKSKIIMDIRNLVNGKMVNGKLQEAQFSEFFYLDHELGHIRHVGSTSNFSSMKKVAEYTKKGKEVSSITQEFVNTQSIQETAAKVSHYAKESPAEFVAETFAGIKSGITYPDDVMALYQKYGGPNLG